MSDMQLTPIEIGLTAAIVAIENHEPQILISRGADGLAGLPFGPFDAVSHRTFEIGLRAWVEQQAGLRLGYVEQLYTFGDRGRHAEAGDTGAHIVSIGYLALTRPAGGELVANAASFAPWYRFFPWEDWREQPPAIIARDIIPALTKWAEEDTPETTRALPRKDRVRFYFGLDGAPWDEERVLDRYELLYEAGLIEEARRDGRPAALARKTLPPLGTSMRFDHRRILATGIARLRAKLKYRPVVFELLPADFTLTELQHTVEAISGRHLHKQNFRRLVEMEALVEPTGAMSTQTGGRPAALYRFRREVLQERPAPGLRVRSRR
ncbi:MAG: NAD regulator [Bradyrhizobium sp.]|uniref:NUDIX hydrolase n=1 Tax=Bradyrhizobium sp. TaxID=376 RepID=UPI001A24FF45|nr:NAD regulator [Bradyrhizobium sp.]MBJ7407666.1 NAD regulator [Bradyrhizobium sp.]